MKIRMWKLCVKISVSATGLKHISGAKWKGRNMSRTEMSIDDAIYCMRSYLPDEDVLCYGCKYYASKQVKDNVFVCRSDEAHKMAIRALERMKKEDHDRHEN